MRKLRRVERLARREEKDIVKRIFLLSVISAVLIFILLTVGVSALGKFAEFLDFAFKGDDNSQASEADIVAPIVDTIPPHTNKENLKISGFSPASEKVEIYKNGEKMGDATIESGRFSYEMLLSDGQNEIVAKAIGAGGIESPLSLPATVVLDKTEPKLEISSPSEGQSFFGNNRISVEGKSETDSQVFVNGFLANVSADGSFDASIVIVEGDQEIEVKALDEAGNTKIMKVKVNYRK